VGVPPGLRPQALTTTAGRNAIATFLRGTKPVRYRHYRAAWRLLHGESRDARATDNDTGHYLWRFTADMLYLIDPPVVREALLPSGIQPLSVERAVLDRDGGVAGFFTLITHARLLSPKAAPDPVAHAWARHLREHPLPTGQIVLGFRRWLNIDCGEEACDTQAASWLDVEREYGATPPVAPHIRCGEGCPDLLARSWKGSVSGRRRTNRHSWTACPYQNFVLDFGPGLVDGWLSSLVATELGLDVECRTIDGEAHELAVRGERVLLTPLQFRLLRHLSGREGKTVSREELLMHVWGTRFTGGRSVVDVRVRSTRGNLAGGAECLQTVRGSGYRLTSDWPTL
jgi:hypothetical protein